MPACKASNAAIVGCIINRRCMLPLGLARKSSQPRPIISKTVFTSSHSGLTAYLTPAPLRPHDRSRLSSCCAFRKHRVDGGEQIRCDGSLEDVSIGFGCDRRQLHVLFRMDAESDQL